MKIKKGMFRIYIVASVLWSVFFYNKFSYYGSGEFFIMTILPLPLYFVLKWILKGFKE